MRVSNSFTSDEVQFMVDLLEAVKEERPIQRFARRPECAKVYRKVMSMLTKIGLRRGSHGQTRTRKT